MGPENQAREVHSQIECEDDVIRSVGQLLRAAREEKHLSIPQVAIETRIRQLYIKAIEDGDLDSLPGEIYKVGFIKTYATFLNLDPFEILRRLGASQDTCVNYNINNKYIIPAEHQRQPNVKILYLSILGAFAFSLFAYVVHNEKKQKETSISFPASQQETPELLLEEQFPETMLQDLPVDEEDAAITDQPMLADEVVDEPAFEKSEKQAASSYEKPMMMPASDALVIIKAIKDSWVQVLDSSEKTIYVRLMHAGDSYDVPKQGEYILNTGNAGGLKIIYNGQEINSLGEEGRVIRGIHLTKLGLSDFFKTDDSDSSDTLKENPQRAVGEQPSD